MRHFCWQPEISAVLCEASEKAASRDRHHAGTHLASEHLKHSVLLAKLTTLQDGHNQSPAAQPMLSMAPLEGVLTRQRCLTKVTR